MPSDLHKEWQRVLEARREEEERRELDSREQDEKRHWLAGQRHDRAVQTPESVRHARGTIDLFDCQEILSEFRSADELVERIVNWRPVPEGGRRRSVVEREVALAIYNRDPAPMQDMVCAPEWRESFLAADELKEKYAAIPDQVLAEACFAFLKKDPPESEEWHRLYQEPYGITEELLDKAIGPDMEEITDEEGNFRMAEIQDVVFSGERGWKVHTHLQRLIEEAELEKGE